MQYIKYSSCLKVSDKNWVWGITDSAESIFFRKCATSLFSVKKHHKTNYFNIKILPSPLFPFAESEKEEQKERKKERKGRDCSPASSSSIFSLTVNLSKTPGSLPIYFIWTATERKGFLADLDSSALRNTKTQRCNLTLSFGIVSEVKQRTNSGICKPVLCGEGGGDEDDRR